MEASSISTSKGSQRLALATSPFRVGTRQFFARSEMEASSISTLKGSQRLALATSPVGWWGG
jgi:hypothetical protein